MRTSSPTRRRISRTNSASPLRPSSTSSAPCSTRQTPSIVPRAAMPSTFTHLRDRIVEGIAALGTIDGVCLVLHGALLVEDGRSGEAELVREIRRRVGDDVLISARLDLHAILSDELVQQLDIWTSYRTAPHRDIPETLRRAMRLLVRAIRGGHKPQAAFVRLPLLLPGEQA